MTKNSSILIPTKERKLSPKDYLNEIKANADIIEHVEFIPPKIGSKGFGLFIVRYSTPVLVAGV